MPSPPPLRQTSFPLETLQMLSCPDDEAALAQTLRNSHGEWGTEYSEAEWVSTGQAMLRHPLVNSEPGWYELFVVTSTADPDRQILSSCAVHLVDALVGTTRMDPTSSPPSPPAAQDKRTGVDGCVMETADLIVRDVKCATVVRVVTPPCFRGHGYGGWMMKQLWALLERRPNIHLSNLFSDVGDYYARKGGWQKFRSDVLRISIHDLETILSTANDTSGLLPSVELISDQALGQVVAHDAQMTRQTIQAMCQENHRQHQQQKTADKPVTVVAIRPHVRQIRWHRLRKEHDLALMKRLGHLPDSAQLGAHGAMIPLPSSSSSFSSASTEDPTLSRPLHHILWCQDVLKHRFRIHRFCHGIDVTSAQDRAEALALLQAAVDNARQLQVEQIEIWNPHQALQVWLGRQAIEREIAKSYLGFCPGPVQSKKTVLEDDGPPQAQEGCGGFKVEWILNEYFPCL